MNFSQIVPAARAGFFSVTAALESHRQHLGAIAKQRRDGGRQAIARTRSHDQHIAEPLSWAARLGDGDLGLHVGGAATGMRGSADEAADAGIDDDLGHELLR